jgi:hypothetical protein
MCTPLVLARFLWRPQLLPRISPLPAGRNILLVHLAPVLPSLQRHRFSSAVVRSTLGMGVTPPILAACVTSPRNPTLSSMNSDMPSLTKCGRASGALMGLRYTKPTPTTLPVRSQIPLSQN